MGQEYPTGIFIVVETDDNLLIASHLTTFPLSICGLMSTFPLGAREERKIARITVFMFYDANAHNLCVE